jgi:hypothetical protein
MFILHKPNMKAADVFPKDMPELVCVNFTCKGRECTRENCSVKHPRKVLIGLGDTQRLFMSLGTPRLIASGRALPNGSCVYYRRSFADKSHAFHCMPPGWWNHGRGFIYRHRVQSNGIYELIVGCNLTFAFH